MYMRIFVKEIGQNKVFAKYTGFFTKSSRGYVAT